MLAALAAPRAAAPTTEAPRRLQLEVIVNGATTKLIGSFTQFGDGRLAATRKELKELGIKPATPGPDEDLVVVRGADGFDYRYDEARQRIYFTLDDVRRVPKTYDLRSAIPETPPPVTDVGAVLNYQLFASSGNGNTLFSFNGANASLDGRVFGPLGNVTQSAILGTITSARHPTALRLDTTYQYADPESLRSIRVGDVISSSLPWTRSIRLGGAQLQRDFSIRPDLVTQPLPSISGSAAVPSTLDVYVNNVRLQSQDVPPGPYQVTNIPTVSPAGSAQIVLRDSSGRQTQTSVPFFTSPRLLRQGIYDYSLEAGAPRLRYGVDSNRYAKRSVGSASLRGGVYDWLTAEAHAEGDAKLQNLGLGVVADLASRGVLSFALSGSRMASRTGMQAYAALDTRIGDIYFHASSQRGFGTYLDLAATTGTTPYFAFQPLPTFGLLGAGLLISSRPPKQIDTITIGAPIAFDRSQISAGFVRLKPYAGPTSNLVTLSYSRPFFWNGNAFFNGYVDLSNKHGAGVFIGASMPLDDSFGPFAPTGVSAGVTRTARGLNAVAEAVRTMQPEPGSYGWRVRESEGASRERLASGSYRSTYGQVEGYVQQYGKSVNGGVTAQGAIAAMGGGMFLSNRVDDAFAVVDAGAPNIDVSYENRPAGRTNAAGLALIPTLRSFQRNKIDIDVRNLPVNAEAERTKDIVAPANRGGVVVRFGVKTETKSAIVIFSRGDKRVVEVGAEGRLDGSTETFTVGYDGRAYIKGLRPENVVVISAKDGDCRASFSYAPPSRDAQLLIGPIPCR